MSGEGSQLELERGRTKQCRRKITLRRGVRRGSQSRRLGIWEAYPHPRVFLQ